MRISPIKEKASAFGVHSEKSFSECGNLLTGKTWLDVEPVDQSTAPVGGGYRFGLRHLFLIGILAIVGLFTVQEAHRQVRLGYEVAEKERRLREVELCIKKLEMQRLAGQTPARIVEKAERLRLSVEPTNEADAFRKEKNEEPMNASKTPKR